MSFWFEPSRTAVLDDDGEGTQDLHPTDVQFITEQAGKWANGFTPGHSNWGTKCDAYVLSYLLGTEFRRFINTWAPPEVVISWGLRLIEMSENHLLQDNAYFLRYGKFLRDLGRRGVGVYLSW